MHYREDLKKKIAHEGGLTASLRADALQKTHRWAAPGMAKAVMELPRAPMMALMML